MFKTKIHAGLMSKCKVCTPDQKPARRKDMKPKFTKSGGTQDIITAIKRQLDEEVGDAELTTPHQLALLQKFGCNAVQIERKMTKPAWVEESEWKSRINQWIAMTTGMKISGVQFRRAGNRPTNQKSKSPNTHQPAIQFPQKAWQKTMRSNRPISPRVVSGS